MPLRANREAFLPTFNRTYTDAVRPGIRNEKPSAFTLTDDDVQLHAGSVDRRRLVIERILGVDRDEAAVNV